MSFDFDAEKVVDSLTIAVVLVDGMHRISYCNARFVEWFGVPNGSRETLIGEDFYKTIRFPAFVDGCYAPFHYAPLQEEPTRSVLSYPKCVGDSGGGGLAHRPAGILQRPEEPPQNRPPQARTHGDPRILGSPRHRRQCAWEEGTRCGRFLCRACLYAVRPG